MLLNELTIRENIFLPQIIAGKPKSQMEQNTQNQLTIFGIEKIAEKYADSIFLKYKSHEIGIFLSLGIDRPC